MSQNPHLLILVSSGLISFAIFLFLYWNASLWDSFTGWLLRDFTSQMQTLNIDTSTMPMYLRWWGLSVVGVFVVCLILGIPIIGVVLVLFVLVAPRFVVDYAVARRRTLLRDQMVGAATAMANSARAGLSLADAVGSIAKEAPMPLAHEFRRIRFGYDNGRPLAEMLREAMNRLSLDGFTLFASALLTCLDRGGRVTDALDRISKSLQENQRLERKLDADTATGRKVVVLLTIFPLVFLVGYYLMDPEATGKLFSTVVGQLVIVAVLVLSFLSALWAKKILSIDL